MKIDPRGLRYCKNVLPANGDVLAGYQYLHIQEAKYTHEALEAMPDAVANWHGYLSRYVDTIRGDFECDEDQDDESCQARHLRLHFAAGAIATAKLALDAALAGHYSQAYGLLRHLLQTWAQITYIRLNQAVAKQWIGSPDGKIYEPKYETVINKLRKLTTDKREKANIGVVEDLIRQLNKGAHPSRILVMQIRTNDPAVNRRGGNLNMEMLDNVMSIGTLAIALLLRESVRLYPEDPDWFEIFDQLGEERGQWHSLNYVTSPDPAVTPPEST